MVTDIAADAPRMTIKGRVLMIRPADNGGTLIKCMAGCETKDVFGKGGIDDARPYGTAKHKTAQEYHGCVQLL